MLESSRFIHEEAKMIWYISSHSEWRFNTCILKSCSNDLVLWRVLYYVIRMLRKPLQKQGLLQQPWKIKKVDEYSTLSDNYHSVPVGAETYGAYGPQGIKLIKSKKYRKLLVKNCLLFYYKVSQWQYNEATLFVLWVVQKWQKA